MTVELLHWPKEEERRARLREVGHPRLLLVEPSASPPLVTDPTEDWVRLPANHRDVQARIESLRRRATIEPTLEEGVLRTGAGWVSLPDLEARIIDELLAKFAKVADRQSLLAAGWPGETPSRNLLDVHLHRLRHRIEPVGLRIRTVRKRGYVLEPAASD